ncbi:MAG: biotin--[acetyl-CoA-carboxylase] ligase [Candidatus Latescibacteria bacterium]|nr:biotin--[acetyl-CoA-carboxylase] ligase [Candidatus Latescibacterota bacterium]
MISRLGRDWFGLTSFDPGLERTADGFLYVLEEVGSTSDFLLGRGASATGRLCRWDGWGWQAGQRQLLQPPLDARPGSVAVARRQSAGRGRLGRRWHGQGGLLMSWNIDPVPSPPVAGLAVWTGLTAVLALEEMTGLPVRLKWPNDVFLGGRKLGGILLDFMVLTPRPRLVAGLGLNVGRLPADLPPDVRARAAVLPVNPARWRTLGELAGAVLRRWQDGMERFLDVGWDEYRCDFDRVDELAGRRVELVSGGERREGLAIGIDDTGALLLRHGDGRVSTALAGDVHVLGVGPVAPPVPGRG